jgi:hypothetical protein
MRATDEELKDLLEGRHLTIYVSTGTLGHRIHLENGKIFMNIDPGAHPKPLENFVRLFGIDPPKPDEKFGAIRVEF